MFFVTQIKEYSQYNVSLIWIAFFLVVQILVLLIFLQSRTTITCYLFNPHPYNPYISYTCVITSMQRIHTVEKKRFFFCMTLTFDFVQNTKFNLSNTSINHVPINIWSHSLFLNTMIYLYMISFTIPKHPDPFVSYSFERKEEEWREKSIFHLQKKCSGHTKNSIC